MSGNIGKLWRIGLMMGCFASIWGCKGHGFCSRCWGVRGAEEEMNWQKCEGIYGLEWNDKRKREVWVIKRWIECVLGGFESGKWVWFRALEGSKGKGKTEVFREMERVGKVGFLKCNYKAMQMTLVLTISSLQSSWVSGTGWFESHWRA